MKPNQGRVAGSRFSIADWRKALRDFRRQAGLSLAELGAMTKLSESSLSRFESGERGLSPAALTRLKEAITDVLSEKKAKEKLAGLRESEAAKKLVFLPEIFGQMTSLASLKSPEMLFAIRGQETHKRVEEKLIQAQGELIRILEELLAAHGEREAEQDAKITDLEKRIADLRDLLGLETGATVLRVKADEKREALTIAGMRKENSEAEE